MLGLAAGAVWMVVSLYVRHPLPWLALPIGALLAWAITSVACARRAPAPRCWRRWPPRWPAIYVNMLIAAVQIAGSMGLGLLDALRTAGAGMLWQLARLRTRPADIGWACWPWRWPAWLAWRTPRRAERRRSRRVQASIAFNCVTSSPTAAWPSPYSMRVLSA